MRQSHRLGFLVLLRALGHAQVITVRMVNVKSEQPLPGQSIKVNLIYDKDAEQPVKYDASLKVETDASGKVEFTLPTPPPSHLWVAAEFTLEHWLCGCAGSITTGDITQAGVVVDSAFWRKRLKAQPGEIVLGARPFTLWERLTSRFRE
jgi:hypothetical protein